MNLRKLAKGQKCTIRLPCCNGDTETTVLAHYRLAGISGMGYKAPDLCGAWACSACHTWVDTHHDTNSKIAHLEGIVRTLAAIDKLGGIVRASHYGTDAL